ncbi:hypothetical protein [Kineosporia babensis]|uniref:PH domain-containing protein n=1 Tax=Kineosporia babensis TaxID=499548 RepID=A0A9X1NDP5_9ACTN|nr:hypothetical protein [Kineosporia babensis]MCD5313262.1 hypothetical protein [Kineosporia babensis]
MRALRTEDQVPAKVEEAARRHGLGRLLHVRRFMHPVVWASGYLSAAIVAAIAYRILRQFVDGWEGEMSRRLDTAVRIAETGLVAFGVLLVLVAVLALARGRRAYYLWEGGFVLQNGLVQTYPWAEVEALLLVRHHTGDLTGEIDRYRLVPRKGRPITIPADPFTEALVKVMLEAGRPVA